MKNQMQCPKCRRPTFAEGTCQAAAAGTIRAGRCHMEVECVCGEVYTTRYQLPLRRDPREHLAWLRMQRAVA